MNSLPNFTLKNQLGESINSQQFLGQPCVIYFYPKDDTPGCTKEACYFRDHFEQFSEAGVKVIGISSDNVTIPPTPGMTPIKKPIATPRSSQKK